MFDNAEQIYDFVHIKVACLGYLLWQSFEINAIPQCIVCMVSIGVAGFLSSEIIRQLGQYAAPWQRQQ